MHPLGLDPPGKLDGLALAIGWIGVDGSRAGTPGRRRGRQPVRRRAAIGKMRAMQQNAPGDGQTAAADLAHMLTRLREADPERALAIAFAPRPARARLALIAALDLEAGATILRAHEPTAALLRIAWWKEALAEAAAGRPQAQPLLRLLAAHRDEPGVEPAALVGLFAAREGFIGEDGALTLAEAHARAQATGGVVNRLWAAALLAGGGLPEEARAAISAAAAHVGTALQLTRYLQAVRREARAGRLWLPGLEPALRDRVPGRRVSSGPWPEELRRLVAGLADAARAELDAAEALRPRRLPRRLTAPFLLSVFVARDIAALASARHDVLAADLGRIGPRELAALWRWRILGLPRRRS